MVTNPNTSMQGGKVSDKEILKAFDETVDTVLTAVEIADLFDITQQAAHSRLARLHEEGKLERKKVGSRAVVWWPVN